MILQEFTYDENRKPVNKIDVNSDWHEPGDNSYLREYEAYNVFRCIPECCNAIAFIHF